MPKYETMPMLRSGKAKDEEPDAHVPYMTTAGERARYKVTVVLIDTVNPGSKSGRLFQGEKPLLRRMDTSDGTNPGGRYLFVMDGDGNIYAGPNHEVNHHSAFLAGGPVAAAGHIEVDNGRLVGADNDSGHYWPPHEFLQQFAQEVASRGVDPLGLTLRKVGQTKAGQLAAAKIPRFVKSFERLPK